VTRAILAAAIGLLLASAIGAQERPQLPPPPPARPGQPPVPHRPRIRLFSPQDLGLLEGPDREQWQKPDQIMDALGIADGSIVADIGAAGGWFTVHLARRVGPNGRVFAEDIQRAMYDAIGRRVQRENLANVTPVLGTVTDPHLPPGIDAALIVEAYGEMEDPVGLLKNVARSLKPQGRIGIVDFTPGAGGPGPAPEQRVNPNTIVETARAAGLHLIARDAVSTFQFLLVFGKSAAR
jgi:predicted methyltransferase